MWSSVWFLVYLVMDMDMVTQVMVLELPALSRAHIANVTTASVRKGTSIVKDMVMVEDMVRKKKKKKSNVHSKSLL